MLVGRKGLIYPEFPAVPIIQHQAYARRESRRAVVDAARSGSRVRSGSLKAFDGPTTDLCLATTRVAKEVTKTLVEDEELVRRCEGDHGHELGRRFCPI